MENKKTFMDRVRPYYSPKEMVKIETAYVFAKYGHSHQMRKQKNENGDQVRYFEHPRSTAIILMDELDLYDFDLVVSCIMHDIFEDSENITPEIVEECFGTEVCKILKTVSKCPKEGYLDRFNNCKSFKPFIIKGCDRLDNLRSLGDLDENFIDKQIKETKEKYFPLFKKMVDICPKEYYSSCIKLQNLIINQVECLIKK